MIPMVDRTVATRNRQSHQFVPGRGYVARRPLKMPAKPKLSAPSCEPPVGVAEGSFHILMPPEEYGAARKPIRMKWHVAQKEWAGDLGKGKRLGFSSAYMAAHGWSYVGPHIP